MKRFQKALLICFTVVALCVTLGVSNLSSTADARELSRGNGVERTTFLVNGVNRTHSRAWGNVVGQNGANFRIRHYEVLANGGTDELTTSGWGSSGQTVRTGWSMITPGLTVAVLVNVSTW